MSVGKLFILLIAFSAPVRYFDRRIAGFYRYMYQSLGEMAVHPIREINVWS